MFGIKEFSAVINPPQGAILAIGTSQTIVVADETTGKRTNLPLSHTAIDLFCMLAARLQTVMNGTLSADGRAIDEDLAARFMETFGKYISNPRLMQL
jgi:pyruvate/2-oxoglutarate dehydrogenase complex dihydrolipoamide acyltransferase (E2) component